MGEVSMDEENCCICFESTADVRRVLSCGHSQFCGDCIDKWLASSNVCPLCRAPQGEAISSAALSPVRDANEILEEHIAEDYEPTDEEVLEYALWLGMSATEQHLFWIAREGLRAPLPEGWRPCRTTEGDIFYFNFQTGETVWDHPCDEFY